MSVCWVLPSYRSTLPHYLYYLYLYYHLYLYKVLVASRSPLTTWPIPSPCVFQQNNELQMLRTARRCVCVYNTCAWNLKLFVCKAFHGSETSLFQQEQVSLWWSRWRIWELQNPNVQFKTQNLQSFIIAYVCSVQSRGVRYPIWFNSMFEFCQKMIHSIFDSILLYPGFNSKYYSIQK